MHVTPQFPLCWSPSESHMLPLQQIAAENVQIINEQFMGYSNKAKLSVYISSVPRTKLKEVGGIQHAFGKSCKI